MNERNRDGEAAAGAQDGDPTAGGPATNGPADDGRTEGDAATGEDGRAPEQEHAERAPAGRADVSADRPTSPTDERRVRHVQALVVAVVALAVAALSVAIFASVSGPAPAAAAPAPAGAPAGPPPLVGPTLLTGRVVDVPDPGTVTVAVQGQTVPVAVVGVDFSRTPTCARQPAMNYARSTLVGQDVTLVPDPTIPDSPTLRRAYVVLKSQLSYTDGALINGWAFPAAGQYRTVFDRELADAKAAEAGMWGLPCSPAS